MDKLTLEYYDQMAHVLAPGYEEANISHLHEEYEKNFPSQGRILDIGCGSGRDLAYLKGEGYGVEGIEGSPAMAQEAIELHPELADFIHLLALPDELPFARESFDGALSVAFLMHLSPADLTLTLREIHRVLKAGAPFFVSIPRERPDIENNRDSKGRLFIMDEPGKWLRTFELANFKKIESYTTEDGRGRENVKWVCFWLERE